MAELFRAREGEEERDQVRRILVISKIKSVRNESHEGVHAAIVEKPEAGAVGGREKIHSQFIEEIAERLNFEREEG